MARSVRIVCTISPRRGVVSPWRDRSGQVERATDRPAEATSSDDRRTPGVITDLAAVKRSRGLAPSA
jgi:hypothetical protein